MGFPHPELLVPEILAFIAALYPLPWHFRTRNVATLSMIFWMSTLNLIHIVNCIVWSNNTDIKVPNWGDFSTVMVVGYNFGIPLAHLILAKQLESLTSLRLRSSLYDEAARRSQKRFDICISFVIPIVGMLLHLSMMDRRFYIVESMGPLPATYWDPWAVIVMAIVPILIAAGCATFTIMALVNISLRRFQLKSILNSNSSVNNEQFYRLLFLAIAELGTCALRAIFNMMSFQNGPQPLGHLGAPQHNFTKIEQIAWNTISPTGHLNLRLQWYTVVACSYVFFLCFCSATETKRFYIKVLRYVFPCIPETRMERTEKLGSYDSGLSNSSGPRTSTGPMTPVTPGKTVDKDDGDFSLEELLNTPRSAKSNPASPWRPGENSLSRGENPKSPKTLDGLEDVPYLAPYQEKTEVVNSSIV